MAPRVCSRFSLFFRQFFSSFLALRGAPRELWLLYFVKLLESYAYFVMSLNLVLFLSEDFGLTDVQAGFVYSTWGVVTSAWGLLVGVAIDYIGVKRSLVLGGLLSCLGRFLVAVSSSSAMVLSILFSVLPIGMSFGIPVMTIGIKRYSNESNRSTAFGLFYSLMNLGAFASGFLTDIIDFHVPVRVNMLGLSFSRKQLLMASGAVCSLLQALLALIFFREIDVSSSGHVSAYRPQRPNVLVFLRTTFRNKNFWRLCLFALVLVGVRTVFRHLDATLPKYMTREFGPDVSFGSFYSINPLMVIFLVPVMSALLAQYDAYIVITVGSYITSVSVFLLCIGPYYAAVVGFLVVLSIGEAIYSPRVYEYTMLIAPKGNEGIYTGLASAPMFVAKFFVGGLSGMLLQEYCPAEGPRNSALMWGWIGIMTVASPVLLTILYGVIHSESVRAGIAAARDEGDVAMEALTKSLRSDDEDDAAAARFTGSGRPAMVELDEHCETGEGSGDRLRVSG